MADRPLCRGSKDGFRDMDVGMERRLNFVCVCKKKMRGKVLGNRER